MKVSKGFKKLGKNEAGIALLMCLFSLLLLTAIGVGLMYMADSDSQVNQNYRDSQRAYFAAQAGLQEARLRINGGLIPGALPSTLAPTGVYYITNSKGGAEVIQPWAAGSPFFDNQICHENFPGLAVVNPGNGIPCGAAPGGNWYTTAASTSPSTNSAAAMDYKWVRITQKMNLSAAPEPISNPNLGAVANPLVLANNNVPICWNGKIQKPLPAGGWTGCTDREMSEMMEYVYRITSLAVTPDGSRRMLQAEVADAPPYLTNAAVEAQDHVTLTGQLTVNGYDNCSCICVEDKKTKITTCTDRVGKKCAKDKYAVYSGGSVEDPTSSETLIAGTTPPVMEDAPWDVNLIKDLIDRYKDLSVDVRTPPYNWTCTAGAYPSQGSCGTQSNAEFGIPPAFPPTPPDNPLKDPKLGDPSKQITYVPGNVQLTAGAIGNGILIVDGDLDIHGGLQFYGLIIVRGIVKFTGGGSNGTNIFGSVLAGKESLVDNVLGGSANIQYDKCSLLQDWDANPPRVITAREVMY
jgi:hypothetical protein